MRFSLRGQQSKRDQMKDSQFRYNRFLSAASQPPVRDMPSHPHESHHTDDLTNLSLSQVSGPGSCRHDSPDGQSWPHQASPDFRETAAASRRREAGPAQRAGARGGVARGAGAGSRGPPPKLRPAWIAGPPDKGPPDRAADGT
jgi:hypothetical protein